MTLAANPVKAAKTGKMGWLFGVVAGIVLSAIIVLSSGFMIETTNTVREGVAALRAASGLPCLVSFACGSSARLLSGESLRDAIRAVAPLEPLAVLVNCLPPSAVAACLPVLREGGLPFGVYANLGEPAGDGSRRSEDMLPERFADTAEHWMRAGARLVGGCCGTTPEHIAALAARLAGDSSSRTR